MNKERKLIDKINRELKLYYDWASYFYVPEEDNFKAKKKLIIIHNEMQYIKTHKYEVKKGLYARMSHTAYIFRIMFIKEALEEKNYPRACNELIRLIELEDILQKRIYNNLLHIFELYLYN